MFRLKNGQEAFQVVDGPDTGKTYQRGVEYESIPAGEGHRFEKVSKPAPKTEAIVENDPKKAKEKK